jgi:predicted DNA binding CopG/RHH family protein
MPKLKTSKPMKFVAFRISEKEYFLLVRKATREGLSLSAYLRKMVEDYPRLERAEMRLTDYGEV